MSFEERRRFLWALFLGGLALLAVCYCASATTLARLRFKDLPKNPPRLCGLAAFRANRCCSMARFTRMRTSKLLNKTKEFCRR